MDLIRHDFHPDREMVMCRGKGFISYARCYVYKNRHRCAAEVKSESEADNVKLGDSVHLGFITDHQLSCFWIAYNDVIPAASNVDGSPTGDHECSVAVATYGQVGVQPSLNHALSFSHSVVG